MKVRNFKLFCESNENYSPKIGDQFNDILYGDWWIIKELGDDIILVDQDTGEKRYYDYDEFMSIAGKHIDSDNYDFQYLLIGRNKDINDEAITKYRSKQLADIYRKDPEHAYHMTGSYYPNIKENKNEDITDIKVFFKTKQDELSEMILNDVSYKERIKIEKEIRDKINIILKDNYDVDENYDILHDVVLTNDIDIMPKNYKIEIIASIYSTITKTSKTIGYVTTPTSKHYYIDVPTYKTIKIGTIFKK